MTMNLLDHHGHNHHLHSWLSKWLRIDAKIQLLKIRHKTEVEMKELICRSRCPSLSSEAAEPPQNYSPSDPLVCPAGSHEDEQPILTVGEGRQDGGDNQQEQRDAECVKFKGSKGERGNREHINFKGSKEERRNQERRSFVRAEEDPTNREHDNFLRAEEESRDSIVYRETTVRLAEDTMADPGGVTPESVPLTFQERGALHMARQGRTFAWAIFLASAGMVVLVVFALLAIFLEMHAPTSLGPTPDSDKYLDPDSIDFGVSDKHMGEMLTVTFPLVDIRTADQNEFIDALRPTKKPKNGVTESPLIIIPIPLFKQANATVVTEGLEAAAAETNARDTLEQQFYTSGYTMKPGSAGSLYSVGQRYGTNETDARGRAGYLMNRASKFIAQSLNLSQSEAVQGIILSGEVGPLQPHEFCPNTTGEVTSCNPGDPYRSYDGSCNNLRHHRWGATYEPYRRILYAAYDDGISSIRKSKNGTDLPNPRIISTVILKDMPSGPPSSSAMLVLWGQFVSHDVTLTAPSTSANTTAVPCCVDGKLVQPQHPECLPLRIPFADPLFTTAGVTCMNFVRSAPASICEFGPREQFNQITSYLDASTVYGSTDAEAAKIRSHFGFSPTVNKGRLPTSYLSDGRPLAMRSTDLNDGCNLADHVEKREFCFKSGDPQVNEYLGQTALNLIWIRQHNLISERLSALNRDWDEKTVFEETRRIVIAQIQHITYNEFLPLLLGPAVIKQAGLSLETKGYYEGYDPELEATISNEFAASAFRLGHSMIQGLMKLVGPHWKNEDFVQIHSLFYNPFKIYEVGGLDAVLRGHMALETGKPGLHMSNQMTDHLFQQRNGTSGYDMTAMDIQRGRDHGISSYLQWRTKCGLKVIQNFTELNSVWVDGAAARVAAVYRSVEDIDLYVGGLAEIPLPGAMVGPTFACILADQFLRLRKGDRFWYENSLQLQPFTPGQLSVLRKTTLARILCDNGDTLQFIQLRPMELESASNPRVPCSSPLIPSLTYEQWELTSSKFVLKKAGEPEDSLESLFSSSEESEEQPVVNGTGITYVNVPILNNNSSNNTSYRKRSDNLKEKTEGSGGAGFIDTKEGRLIQFAKG